MYIYMYMCVYIYMEATVKFCEKTITAAKSVYVCIYIYIYNLKYKGNRRAGNKNNRMAIVTNHTTNMQPNLEPRPSYSQVLQTSQPTYQPKPPPPRRETDRRAYFNQGQGRQVTNQNRATFNFGSQPQVRPAAFTMPQKSTAFSRPHNTKKVPKNEVAAPAQTGEMSTIFMNTMQQLSHAAAAITELEKFFRQNYSGSMTEEEQ